MDSKVNEALERHQKGYNCAQAIVCTYCNEFGIDEQTAYRMAESFGFGMGIQSVCGALSGALMMLGLKNSGGLENIGKTKGSTYRYARELATDFESQVHSFLCSEIKAPPVQCSCDGCIACAAKLVEKHLLSET